MAADRCIQANSQSEIQQIALNTAKHVVDERFVGSVASDAGPTLDNLAKQDFQSGGKQQLWEARHTGRPDCSTCRYQALHCFSAEHIGVDRW